MRSTQPFILTDLHARLLRLGGFLTFPLAAYHTAEIQYLFDGGDLFGPTPLSYKQFQLSGAMVSYWTQFAKTGNPNSSGEPAWVPYSPAVDQFQSLIPAMARS